jgi:signal transduction histidine kinase
VAISNANLFVELSKTQAEAAQKEKMAVIGTLAAGINHEICNPLGIARGQCETFLLNKQDGLYDKMTPEEQVKEAMRIMDLVIHETDRATSITKKLSTFAKPSKAAELDKVYVDKELDEVLMLVGHELKMDQIEFKRVIPNALTAIWADKKQIQEVLFNLIRNAAQAIMMKQGSPPGGKITFSAQEINGTVHIDIADTGCGIPESKMGQIFNPFYTTKEPGKGTGLGLFIVRQIVERNKGKITLKSKEGIGTTFTLEFPVAEQLAMHLNQK